MRGRTVDIALIAGLVIVAIVILFTLFSPLPPRERTASPSAERTETSSPPQTETGEPSSETQDEPQNEPQPSEVTAVTPDEAAQVNEATPEATTTQDAAEDANEAGDETPAGDTFTLERVGFSFAAGELGACSIPLEPWRHVAVSRDILGRYPCGSEVNVILDDEVAGRNSLRAIVGDTMGSSVSRTVNIYVAPEEPALEYGVQTGRLEP